MENTDRALRGMLNEVADRIEEKASLPFRSSYIYGQTKYLVKGSPKYEKPSLDPILDNIENTIQPGHLRSFSTAQSIVLEKNLSKAKFSD